MSFIGIFSIEKKVASLFYLNSLWFFVSYLARRQSKDSEEGSTSKQMFGQIELFSSMFEEKHKIVWYDRSRHKIIDKLKEFFIPMRKINFVCLQIV